MQQALAIKYQQLHPLLKVAIYVGTNYGLIFLTQFVGPLGEMAVNIFLCLSVIFFTKFILTLEGRKLDEIGWRPLNNHHWKQLITGTVVGMCMLVTAAFIVKWQTGFRWENANLPSLKIAGAFVAVFASAYVQELAFRGYPFQLLLKKYGLWPAQIIIALLFGLMHLDGGMSAIDVASTMFTTGIGSLIFALAYLKTKNLALPVGIHFGWNFLQLLLPRHPSMNGKGIVKIAAGSFDASKLNTLTWILPYTLIMAVVGIWLITAWKRLTLEA
ncbi:MAG: CPBP family intramembrane glutamic endopeptidase [Chitinophagaceae bacterium]